MRRGKGCGVPTLCRGDAHGLQPFHQHWVLAVGGREPVRAVILYGLKFIKLVLAQPFRAQANDAEREAHDDSQSERSDQPFAVEGARV